MGRRGPQPSEDKLRRNKTPETPSHINPVPLYQTDNKERGFKLPQAKTILPEGQEWSPIMRKQWQSWRESPAASYMLSEADWYEALRAAMLLNDYYVTGNQKNLGEIRQMVDGMGLSPYGRYKQGIAIAATASASPVGNAQAIGTNVIDMQSRVSALIDEEDEVDAASNN